MIDSALDLFTQAASNSLFIFCFCNLIIAIILIGSKEPQETGIPLQQKVVNPEIQFEKLENSIRDDDDDDDEGISEERELEDSGNKDFVDGDDDEDDELRKRAEEFIAKVNGEWRAERFRIVN